MSIRKFVIISAMAVGLANIGGAAFAQAATPSKVVIVDEEAIRRGSKVGQALNQQLVLARDEGIKQLNLEALSQEIQTEEAALKPQVQALTQEQINANAALKTRVEALNRKKGDFLGKAQQLEQLLSRQSQNYQLAFATAMGPAIEFAAKAANADIVASSSSTWYAKPTVDISAKVIARLDATVPTLDALRAAVAPPQQAAPASGQIPAVPRPGPITPGAASGAPQN